MTERYYKLGYLNIIIIIKNDTGIVHNDDTIGRSIMKQFMFKHCSLIISWNLIPLKLQLILYTSQNNWSLTAQ